MDPPLKALPTETEIALYTHVQSFEEHLRMGIWLQKTKKKGSPPKQSKNKTYKYLQTNDIIVTMLQLNEEFA